MEYSFIDITQNDLIPLPSINAGLYSTDNITFSKQPWGNDYLQPHIPPDAGVYASQFYAKHHIPSAQDRLGNSKLIPDIIISKYSDPNYNNSCYNE